jgi:hypothetical protein
MDTKAKFGTRNAQVKGSSPFVGSNLIVTFAFKIEEIKVRSGKLVSVKPPDLLLTYIILLPGRIFR